MGVTKELCMLLPKNTKARAIKNTVPLITNSSSGAECAPAQVSGHTQSPKPALLNW